MRQKNVNEFARATQLVCYEFIILVSMNLLVLKLYGYLHWYVEITKQQCMLTYLWWRHARSGI